MQMSKSVIHAMQVSDMGHMAAWPTIYNKS